MPVAHRSHPGINREGLGLDTYDMMGEKAKEGRPMSWHRNPHSAALSICHIYTT